jgi:hypothetical protein
MSLLTVLKSVGKDLSHVGTWIEDGLKLAGPVVAGVDPALGPIITTIESVVSHVQASASEPINAATLQAIVTAVAATLKVTAAPAPAPATS